MDNNLVSCSGLKNTIGWLVGRICMENCPMNKSLWSIIILENKAGMFSCLKRADSHYCRDQGPENNFSKWCDVCVCNLETRHFVCSVVFVLFWNDSLCLSGEPGGPDNDDDATTQDIWYCSIYLILTMIRYFHINYVKTIVIYNSFKKFWFSFP